MTRTPDAIDYLLDLGAEHAKELEATVEVLRARVVELEAALEEIAKPDGLTEASAGAMVFEDLKNKKTIARAALAPHKPAGADLTLQGVKPS